MAGLQLSNRVKFIKQDEEEVEETGQDLGW